MEEKKSRIKSKKKWILIISVIIMGGFALLMVVQTGIDLNQFTFRKQYMGIEEIPMNKLNQGYDLVCKSRDKMELCIFNGTTNTIFDQNFTTNVVKYGTNQTYTVSMYTITPQDQKNGCIRTLHAEMNNNGICNSFVGFPKDRWHIDIQHDPLNHNNFLVALWNFTSQVS